MKWKRGNLCSQKQHRVVIDIANRKYICLDCPGFVATMAVSETPINLDFILMRPINHHKEIVKEILEELAEGY